MSKETAPETPAASGPQAIVEMSFEEAMTALEGIVRKLETGDVPLEESIALYEQGDALRSHCDAKLKAAEARVAQITLGPQGGPGGPDGGTDRAPTGAAPAEYD
ncbi:MAG: exodeoxyribonuclease VII small subunit [Pseudomonadota bacterium]